MNPELADASLVLAIIKSTDHLKARAERHLRSRRLLVPFSVGIELLFVANKLRRSHADVIGSASRHFEVDRLAVLFAAAQALDKGIVTTVFDAVHGAEALVARTTLHTSDERLIASRFPTTRF